MSEQGKVNINSKSISSGIQYTPRAARMYTQVLPVGVETDSSRDCSGGDTVVTMDWSGIQVLTAAHLLFVTEAKQEYIVQTTSVVRQMSGGIFPLRPSTSVLLPAATTHLRTLPAAK